MRCTYFCTNTREFISNAFASCVQTYTRDSNICCYIYHNDIASNKVSYLSASTMLYKTIVILQLFIFDVTFYSRPSKPPTNHPSKNISMDFPTFFTGLFLPIFLFHSKPSYKLNASFFRANLHTPSQCFSITTYTVHKSYETTHW
jgi:hypothetical protein